MRSECSAALYVHPTDTGTSDRGRDHRGAARNRGRSAPARRTLPAILGGIGVIRPATAGGQLERDAPATNAATM